MAILYKGAAPGTHWNTIDARTAGGFFSPPGRPPNAAAVVSHITTWSSPSPFVSFTASYAIAHAYASPGATLATPGFIYTIDTTIIMSLTLVDPVREIADDASIASTGSVPTHHDGGKDLLLGITDSLLHSAVLTASPLRAGAALVRPPTISPQLNAIIWALRDSEVLVKGGVPPACIVSRQLVP